MDIRNEFPILHQQINGKPLVYLDNAATSQKPLIVLKAMQEYYEKTNANIHRGIHTLAEEATLRYEQAREKIAKLIGATPEEVIFTPGTTIGINMLAYMLSYKPGDEIVVTQMEHHSNFVIWQKIAKQHNLKFKVIPITPDYRLDIEAARRLITPNTKVLAVSHISNVLGTINPVKELAKIAHENGALIVVDGAQAVAHTTVNVKDLDVDFYAFSGHKMYGPTGIGILYGKSSLLKNLEPAFAGGGTIEDVTEERTTYLDAPHRFEPGTPNIAGAIGLGAAADFIESIGVKNIERHEHELIVYALDKLKEFKNVALIGPQDHRSGAISIVVDKIHAHDLSAAFDKQGIAVRAGFHCAHPLAKSRDIPPTARISFAIYNTKEDVDRFIAALKLVSL